MEQYYHIYTLYIIKKSLLPWNTFTLPQTAGAPDLRSSVDHVDAYLLYCTVGVVEDAMCFGPASSLHPFDIVRALISLFDSSAPTARTR